MKSLKYNLTVLLVVLPLLGVRAEGLFPYRVQIPDSINVIDNPDSLTPFLNSEKAKDRLAAIAKMGNIGNSESVHELIALFEKEPTSVNSEVIKYHLLKSIGEIGGPDAEQYLLSVISDYAPNIDNETQAFSIEDSLSSLLGAFEGLYLIGSDTASAVFQNIYENEGFYWLIRSKAYEYSLMSQLSTAEFAAPVDSIDFLINELIKVGKHQKLRNSNGDINNGFVKQRALGFLLFNYREISESFLAQAISDLPPDDPALPELEKIKNNMENNPPVSGN